MCTCHFCWITNGMGSGQVRVPETYLPRGIYQCPVGRIQHNEQDHEQTGRERLARWHAVGINVSRTSNENATNPGLPVGSRMLYLPDAVP
jgi:hypothetical protein